MKLTRYIWAVLLALMAVVSCGGSSASHATPTAFLYHPLPAVRLGNGFGFNSHAEVSVNGPSLMQGTGAQFVRHDFSWDAIERDRGVFDWSHADKMVRQYDGTGIRIVGILAGNSRAYGHAPNDGIVSGENWRAFLRFVEAVVSRYRDKGIIWELWNEPNLDAFWAPKPDPDAYARLSHDVRRVFDQISAREALVGGSLSPVTGSAGAWDHYLQRLVNLGATKDWDAFSFHPYCVYPEESRAFWRTARGIIGPDLPMIATEQGYCWRVFESWGWVGTDWGPHPEIDPSDEFGLRKLAAFYVLKCYEVNEEEGVAITIVYDWPETVDQMGFVKVGSEGQLEALPGLNVVRDYFQKLAPPP